jgi:hypothetical protein
MNRYPILPILLMLIVITLLVGCNGQIGNYIAASTVSNGGFARDERQMQELQGQELRLWGFVDHSNLYGDESAKAILEEWWSGDGPDAFTWRFNLKVGKNDEAGHSFPVYVTNDKDRDDLLRLFVADARAQQPTRVFVTGRIFTNEAPTNITSLTGLHMELDSSSDILLEPPGDA